MPVVAAGELDDLLRPVTARARRSALIVASVPLLTIRIMSTAGTRAMISSASSTSAGVGVPKLKPRAAACCTAATTSGWAWPRINGPQPQRRST